MNPNQNTVHLIVIKDKRRVWSGETSVSRAIFTISMVLIILLVFGAVLFGIGYIVGSYNHPLKMSEDSSSPAVKDSRAPVQPDNVKSEPTSSPEPPPPERVLAPPSETKVTNVVLIEDFDAHYEARTEKLRFRFVIKNPATSTIAGYTFIIFKPEPANIASFRVYPKTALNNQGLPLNFKEGLSFSIRNQKIVNGTITAQRDITQAEIIVYSQDGQLIGKKNVP